MRRLCLAESDRLLDVEHKRFIILGERLVLAREYPNGAAGGGAQRTLKLTLFSRVSINTRTQPVRDGSRAPQRRPV